MKPETSLLNPNGKLIHAVEPRLRLARKTKPLWAKVVAQGQVVQTLEGLLQVEPGDCLCRGIQGEIWPQKSDKLHEKYVATGEVDLDGWERFDPKPEASAVEATQIVDPFQVRAKWGMLTGKANDYLVRSTTDPTDIWIVDCAIFDASYEFESRSSP